MMVSMESKSQKQVAKIDGKKVAACMTCPLCNKFYRKATTICECLHTFCRKCIYIKLTREGLKCCPVCRVDLGVAPLDKLRADNNLEDIKVKLFPSNQKRQCKEPEGESPNLLPAKSKEKPLSSLVVRKLIGPTRSCINGRRPKLTPRRRTALQAPAVPIEQSHKTEDSRENLSSSETLLRIAQESGQNSDADESSKQQELGISAGNTDELLNGKADHSKPLSCLVETASVTQVDKTSQGTVSEEQPRAVDNEANVHRLEGRGNGSNLERPRTRASRQKSAASFEEINLQGTVSKEQLPTTDMEVNLHRCGNGSNVPGRENDLMSGSSTSETPRTRARQQKIAAVSEGMNSPAPAQAVVEEKNKCDVRFSPVWFSLVASENQEGGSPLPQIPSCYIRVRDGSLPVSYVQKYLMKKLGLSSETEVEISLQGQPLLSTLQLHSLVEWWVQTSAPASETIRTSVGSSAKDFVMVLSYSRKARSS